MKESIDGPVVKMLHDLAAGESTTKDLRNCLAENLNAALSNCHPELRTEKVWSTGAIDIFGRKHYCAQPGFKAQHVQYSRVVRAAHHPGHANKSQKKNTLSKRTKFVSTAEVDSLIMWSFQQLSSRAGQAIQCCR